VLAPLALQLGLDCHVVSNYPTPGADNFPHLPARPIVRSPAAHAHPSRVAVLMPTIHSPSLSFSISSPSFGQSSSGHHSLQRRRQQYNCSTVLRTAAPNYNTISIYHTLERDAQERHQTKPSIATAKLGLCIFSQPLRCLFHRIAA